MTRTAARPVDGLRPAAIPFTIDEVMLDLEAGRSQPLRPVDRLLALPARRRPRLGGPRFTATYLAARVLGRVHPRLARRALLSLWFTPWVHAAGQLPVTQLDDDLVDWSLRLDGSIVPGGRTMRGYAGGRGPTVVLVHGWSGRAADWRHLAHELIADGWRVVVPDLPAHGATGGRVTDVFELGRAVAAVLRAERPTALLAHSLGFPSVMIGIENGGPEPAAVVALAPGRRAAHALDTFAGRARLRPALVAELRRGIALRFGTEVWDVLDVDRSLPAVRASGLVVHDVEDDEVPVADGRAIVAAWPGARLVETSGLGHRRVLRDAGVARLVVDELAAVRAHAASAV